MFKKVSPLLIIEPDAPINIFGFLENLSQGRGLNSRPGPPVGDLLDGPIYLHQPPKIILRHRKFSSRVLEIFINRLLSEEQRLQKELHSMIAGIMASVWPQTAEDLRKKGWIGSFGGSSWSKTRVRHPYHLNFAFDALAAVPKDLQTERRALELILAVVLREYKKRMSAAREAPFSFEAEARRHGLMGYRIERQIRLISHQKEQAETVQEIYNCYYNAANYYQYSLISGEELLNDGTMFSIYCRSILFNAHIQDNGRVLGRLRSRQLPERERVMFFVLRDSALRRRYNRDPDYAAKIKALVKLFPRSAKSGPAG